MTSEQDVWYHICLWFDYPSSTRRVYVQGEAMAEEQFESLRPFYLNGTIVLGHDQDDYPGGGFDWYQSLSGKITQVNFWGRALKEEEIRDIARCSSDLQGDIVSWDEAPWFKTPKVNREDVALETLCQPREEPYFLTFPETRTIEASKYLCNTFGTDVAVPGDDKQNQRLATTAEQFAESCGARGALWIGIHDLDTEGEWITFPGKGRPSKPWTYSSFRNQQPDGGITENCAIVELLRGGWSDWNCGTSNLFCVACMSEKPVSFTLRGLCEESKYQYEFSFMGYVNNKPFWRGLYNYQIKFQEQKWILEDLYTSTEVATKDVPEPTSYPMGVGMWNVLVNKTICAANVGDSHTFSLTSCDHTFEYTCNDGSCISSDRRCNLRNDCSDGSDEDGCENVVLAPGYRPNLPPPPTNQGQQSAPVGLAVIMDRFSKIDTLNMEVTLDFSVVLSWTEPRSNYLNLKSPPKINVVQVRDGKSVWRPSMNFPSGNDILRVRLETFTIIRKGSPIADDLSRPLQGADYMKDERRCL
ncbi:uncharacterized protein LOC143034229 [Oratosquilla oratoria]|uniref:uncharacterized protein LOC143034229 n=1 Tax=Oratosquilla oratoria TaxID=337810 RepID=UPI003F757B9A